MQAYEVTTVDAQLHIAPDDAVAAGVHEANPLLPVTLHVYTNVADVEV